MKTTRKISVWPVGLVGGLGAEGPVCENDTVVSWHTSWAKARKFPLDFAGFAIHIDVLLGNPKILVNSKANIGYMETDYLEQVAEDKEELEPKADNCTEVCHCCIMPGLGINTTMQYFPKHQHYFANCHHTKK